MCAIERLNVEMVERLFEVCDLLAKEPRRNESALDIALKNYLKNYLKNDLEDDEIQEESKAILDAVAAKAGLDSAMSVLSRYGQQFDLPRCKASRFIKVLMKQLSSLEKGHQDFLVAFFYCNILIWQCFLLIIYTLLKRLGCKAVFAQSVAEIAEQALPGKPAHKPRGL